MHVNVEIAKNMEEFLKDSMAKWKTELFVMGKVLVKLTSREAYFREIACPFVVRIVHDPPDTVVKTNESWVSIQRNT